MRPRNRKKDNRSSPFDVLPDYILKHKKILSGVLITLLLVLIITAGTGYHLAGGTAVNVPRVAVISSLEGSVMVREAGQAVSLPAEENMEVQSGDLIITGAASSAVILFDDGSLSRIDSNSRIEIESLYRQGEDGPEVTVIKGDLGAIWNNVKDVLKRNSRFETNTPLAVAGVRGTLFIVKIADNGETLFRVYEGIIGASGLNPGNEFNVSAFEQVRFMPGMPAPDAPEPIDFSDISDFELFCLLQDAPHIFIALLDLAAERGEQEFLERVNDLLDAWLAAKVLSASMQYVKDYCAAVLSAAFESEPEQEPEPEPETEPDPVPQTDTSSEFSFMDPDFTVTLPPLDFPGRVTVGAGKTKEQMYTITVDVYDGWGSVSGGGTFPAGTEITVTATPDPGNEFVGWFESGVLVPEAGESYTFTVIGHRTLLAGFQSL